MIIRRKRPQHCDLNADLPEIVRLWIMRILINLGGHREFIGLQGFGNDSLALALGLEHWIDPVAIDFNPKAVRTEVRKLCLNGEKHLRDALPPSCIHDNVARLAEVVGLSEVDCRILEFAVLIQGERALDDAADYLGQLSSVKVFHVLSVLLELPESDIRLALGAQGILAKSGLVSVDRNGASPLRSKLDLLSDSFADHISSSEADPINLLRETVATGLPGQLGIADFEHIAPSLAILRPYLRQAIATKRKGVNLMLHGVPGTGKNQLAKALAREIDCELYEVASENADGDPVSSERRLRAFRAAQSFFSQHKAILLFDEVEDVFDDGDGSIGRKSTAQKRKAWINRMLEENSVPTLWLSNSIDALDPAFIRRFDMVIELPIPPLQQRTRIIIEAYADLLSVPSAMRIAGAEKLAPAVVTRAASVVNSIREELGPVGTASALELLINNTLQAQGHKPVPRKDEHQLSNLYDPAFIHADADLAKVAAGLARSKSGRLCLYGPPGTGKTAYARWLARQIGVPLLVRRASDLMSKWLGEGEKNIANAFKQAEQEGALLLIDEVDSFLQDRRSAGHGWEVSLVNEMLTQLEAFPGLFVASTNLMDGLDPAALRRFDLKVKFDFLKPEQSCALLRRYCTGLRLAAPRAPQLARLKSLKTLTPGDFAAVARQNRFRPVATCAALVAALEAECAVKEAAKSAIGFL